MGNYLIAAYNLRIKRLYQTAKENIKNKLSADFLRNRKILLKFVLTYMKRAWKEGIDYAVVDSQARVNTYIKPDYKIATKAKTKILKEYLLRVMIAERVYKTKMENYKDLSTLKKTKVDKEGSQERQILGEYINGINAAINITLINTGREGQAKIYKQL